jgi:RNA polymerase sigma factor (sigma-70 family)
MKQSITDLSNEKLESEIRRNPNDSCLWNELFTRLQRQLFPRALRTCNGNVHDTEDLVQDVFLDLVRVKKISDIKSLTAYAHTITRNKCSQWIKQKQKTEGLIVPTGSDRDDEEEYDIQSDQPAPDDRLVQDEVVDEVFSAIEAFFKHYPKHWEIIRLNMFDKLSHKEIAVQLGIREGASRRRLTKAVTELRTLCDKHNITPEGLKYAVGRYYDEMSEEE